ncbi:MAG: DUF72 domain-containing protein [Deltaproteobacteria bacterium]|nr:DUF72 domain-containing protein [Deltaproteobacteria bacterium]
MSFPEHVYVGTSSWSCQDWLGSFYPANLKPRQFIECYARHFRAVEIDSTYYSIPAPSVVTAWKERTPPGFIFSAQVPGAITHHKILQDCQQEFTMFLKRLEPLEDRLGPLLLQFPYFNKNSFASRHQFDKLLRPFLKTLPGDFKFALEIRNKTWISWDFLELLREHSVAFVLVAQAWMPSIDVLARALDLVTGDFFYVRFIGDRTAIESKTRRWDRLVEDKTSEMSVWAGELKKIVGTGVRTYAFFNNHYAGFAPGSVKLFHDLWQKA